MQAIRAKPGVLRFLSCLGLIHHVVRITRRKP